MRTVYVNGQYVPENEAKVSIFDRGFTFADGVYEVTTVIGGKLCDYDGHMKRLQRSLKELQIDFNTTEEDLLVMHRELVKRNNVDEGWVYMQITRGEDDRDFVFPAAGTPTTMVAFTQAKPLVDNPRAAAGVSVHCVDDKRWGRCDIKTVQLLYPSLAKMEAKKHGAGDAWFVKDGYVTEGASNNAYIVTQDGTIVTRQLSSDILPGITRNSLLKLTEKHGMKVEERAFTVEEACQAKESFSTSASAFVMPIIKINDTVLGDGKPGPVALNLRKIYIEEALRSAI